MKTKQQPLGESLSFAFDFTHKEVLVLLTPTLMVGDPEELEEWTFCALPLRGTADCGDGVSLP